MIIFLNITSDYIIEKDPLVNKYISVPKDKGESVMLLLKTYFYKMYSSVNLNIVHKPLNMLLIFAGNLNCAAFVAGIIEAVLNGCNFVSTTAFLGYFNFHLSFNLLTKSHCTMTFLFQC